MGLDPKSISANLRRMGVPRRSHSEACAIAHAARHAEIADGVVAAYKTGLSLFAVASRFNCAVPTVERLLAQAGERLRTPAETSRAIVRRRYTDIEDDIVRLYLDGVSENALSKRFGPTRRTIRRILLRAGVKPRGPKESSAVWYASLSPEERMQQGVAARAARRATREARESSRWRALNRAQTNFLTGVMTGQGEAELQDMLQQRSLAPIPQFPCGTYNIDLAVETVAVEVHLSTNMPLTVARLRKRTMDLLQRGWSVLYVWTPRDCSELTNAAADHVIAFLQETEGDPAAPRKYRVIRGTGEFVTEGGLDLD